MRKLAVTSLLLLITGCSDELLIPEKRCGVPCAIVDGGVLINEDALTATCRPGTSECDEDKNIICPNYTPPEDHELCGSFKDDDCNPDTTEEDISIAPGSVGNTCYNTEKGVCKRSYMVCVNGEMVCDRRDMSSEVCDADGKDEDCDGLVNDDDPSLVLTIPSFRYDGDPSTANIGACRVGVAMCDGNVQRYEGMVLPRAEECGNNIDDDCDGAIDEQEGDVAPRSFLLLIDYSGSMTDYIDNVEQALCDWSINRPNDYFGIGGFGISSVNNVFEYEQIAGFSTATDACQQMSAANPIAGGSEYSARAGLLFLDDNSWPTTDRNIIIFSDEEYQQYSSNEAPLFVQECTDSSIVLGIYTNSDVEYSYQEITDGCGGWIEYLLSTNAMIQTLTSHFAGHCSQ